MTDKTQGGSTAADPSRPRPDDRAAARQRARAYLDLWERHVGRTATRAEVPSPQRGPTR